MINFGDLFVKSQFVQAVCDGDLAVIWHSLFGYPKIISIETLEFLEIFSKPKMISSCFSEKPSDEDLKAIRELIDGYFLVPDRFNDRAFLEGEMKKRERSIIDGSMINYLELIMSEVCNFRCTYCIHFNNLETSNRINNPKKIMRFVMAKEIVDWYIGILRMHKKNIAEINFGGGEPLLAWLDIKEILKYCYVAYGSEFKINFSINTNASLITQEIAKVLKEYRVKIASSLDGLRKGNDSVRMTKSGSGTFSEIVHGFKILSQAEYPIDGIAVTVTKRNFHELNKSIIDWAVANGMKNVRVDIDVIGMVEVPVKDIIEKLMRIRCYASEQGIDVPGFWSRPAENLNESTLNSYVAFCGAVRGNSVCASPSGNIYGCGYSNIQLGNISELKSFYAPESAYYHFVKNRFTGATKMCKGCMIEGQCGGGCNITQEFTLVAKTAKIERMCNFYRNMTQEILLEQLKRIRILNNRKEVNSHAEEADKSAASS